MPDPSYEMVRCSRCSAMNAADLIYCRKCNANLSKTGAFTIPIWAVLATIGLIVMVTLLVISSLMFDLGPVVALGFSGLATLLMVVGGLWFLFEAFRENVLWGLACIFIPFASLLFLILHVDKAIKPFLVSLAGAFLFAMGPFFLRSLN